MLDKPLEWIGSAHAELQAFPPDARRVAGFQLRRVQRGFEPNDWKPMASVGPGVREIRIRTELAHRVFYVATCEEAVYVLHAFEQRTGKTTRRDLELGRRRFRELLARRRRIDADEK